jgi:hypothetical protein
MADTVTEYLRALEEVQRVRHEGNLAEYIQAERVAVEWAGRIIAEYESAGMAFDWLIGLGRRAAGEDKIDLAAHSCWLALRILSRWNRRDRATI